jgi:formate-dependent nitrite reductase membrane component NrfD
VDDRSDSFEERLTAIRQEAAARGLVDAPGVRPAGSPILSGDHSSGYYGLPLLKPPVWTWEIPAYFFVGGTAGASAVIGAVARTTGASPTLARDARWIAAAGGVLAPPLLISDLGRPERCLNMLRVFKARSPMSLGAWTLVAFSNAASASVFVDLVDRVTGGRLPIRIVGDAAETLSASTGLVLATYTGVLIGATAIPVWSHNVHLLPVHFAASSVGTAASILELMGHEDQSLNNLAIGAAAVKMLVGLAIEAQSDPALLPLKTGRSGLMMRSGGLLSGPLPMVLRMLGGHSMTARRAAAISTIAGSLLTRFAWLVAGRASAEAPAQPAIDAAASDALPHADLDPIRE